MRRGEGCEKKLEARNETKQIRQSATLPLSLLVYIFFFTNQPSRANPQQGDLDAIAAYHGALAELYPWTSSALVFTPWEAFSGIAQL
jgi:hypothetical protein